MFRFFNRWRGASAYRRSQRLRPPPSSTPVFDQAMRNALLGALAKIALIPAVPLILLMIFGHPGLRTSYTWNGHGDAPVYYQCHYLAFDGWHRLVPTHTDAGCPLVEFFPVAFLPVSFFP